MRNQKPKKKTDTELWNLIAQKIGNCNYIFLNHARQRLNDRDITDIAVLDILENKTDRKRKRNKSKDTYVLGYKDWNYCIEGIDIDERRIRIIISFNDVLMLIITVIHFESLELH